MHSFGYRANGLVTFALTILAIMCAVASFSDSFNSPSPSPSPSAHVQVLDINWFQKQLHGNDEVGNWQITVNVSLGTNYQGFLGDLESLVERRGQHDLKYLGGLAVVIYMEWNTKQVFDFVAAEYESPINSLNQIPLWDGIIPSKENAKFPIHTSNKYRFIDQGSNLRGKEFNMTLHWHVMPKTGKMFADKIVMTGYRLQEEYR